MIKTKMSLDGVIGEELLDKCEQTLNGMPGVEAEIDRKTKLASISFDETKLSISDICSEISRLSGVRVRPGEHIYREEKKKQKGLGVAGRTAAVLALSAVILLLRILNLFDMGIPLVDGSPILRAMTEIFLFACVAWFARKMFRDGVIAVLKLRPDTGSIAAIGSLAAVIFALYSIARIISGESEYMSRIHLDACAIIVSVVMLCGLLREKSRGRTDEPVKKLSELFPKTATVIIDDSEVSVKLDEITVGDSVLVKPMESFPCDGVIEAGRTSVNEVLFTGEITPAVKTAGERVFAGTVNTSGFITIRAERVGKDTALSRMIRSVKSLSGTKQHTSEIVGRAEKIYSALLLLAAFIALGVTAAVGRGFEAASALFISILVIYCPCALGLVAPVVSVFASAKATQAGVVYKDIRSLERARLVNTVVMDMTGTITVGKLFVTDVLPFGTDEKEVIRLAASLENNSAHPAAEAILDYAAKNDIELTDAADIKAFAGYGITGRIDGTDVSVCGIDIAFREENEGYYSVCEPLVKDGKTVMAVMKNELPIGVIAMSDKLKPTSKSAVAKLNSMGLKTMILTGDNEIAARRTAQELEFSGYSANVLPGKKAEAILELKKKGNTVAMIGDSVNDSVALAASDISVAIGTGSPIAVSLGQIVLVRNDLRDMAAAIALSDVSSRIISENIFWTIGFQAVLLTAATGILHALHVGVAYQALVAACILLSAVVIALNTSRISRLDLSRDDLYNRCREIALRREERKKSRTKRK